MFIEIRRYVESALEKARKDIDKAKKDAEMSQQEKIQLEANLAKLRLEREQQREYLTQASVNAEADLLNLLSQQKRPSLDSKIPPTATDLANLAKLMNHDLTSLSYSHEGTISPDLQHAVIKHTLEDVLDPDIAYYHPDGDFELIETFSSRFISAEDTIGLLKIETTDRTCYLLMINGKIPTTREQLMPMLVARGLPENEVEIRRINIGLGNKKNWTFDLRPKNTQQQAELHFCLLTLAWEDVADQQHFDLSKLACFYAEEPVDAKKIRGKKITQAERTTLSSSILAAG